MRFIAGKSVLIFLGYEQKSNSFENDLKDLPEYPVFKNLEKSIVCEMSFFLRFSTRDIMVLNAKKKLKFTFYGAKIALLNFLYFKYRY